MAGPPKSIFARPEEGFDPNDRSVIDRYNAQMASLEHPLHRHGQRADPIEERVKNALEQYERVVGRPATDKERQRIEETHFKLSGWLEGLKIDMAGKTEVPVAAFNRLVAEHEDTIQWVARDRVNHDAQMTEKLLRRDDRITELEKQLATAQSTPVELQDLQSQLQESQKKLDEITKERQDLETKVKEEEMKLGAGHGSDDQLQSRREELKATIKKLTEYDIEVKAKSDELQEARTKLDGDSSGKSDETEHWKEMLTDANKELATLRAAESQRKEDISSLQNELEAQRTELLDATNKHTELEKSDSDTITESEISSLKTLLKDKDDQLAAAETQIDELKRGPPGQDTVDLQESLQETQEELVAGEALVKELEDQLREVMSENEALEERVKKIEETKTSTQATKDTEINKLKKQIQELESQKKELEKGSEEQMRSNARLAAEHQSKCHELEMVQSEKDEDGQMANETLIRYKEEQITQRQKISDLEDKLRACKENQRDAGGKAGRKPGLEQTAKLLFETYDEMLTSGAIDPEAYQTLAQRDMGKEYRDDDGGPLFTRDDLFFIQRQLEKKWARLRAEMNKRAESKPKIEVLEDSLRDARQELYRVMGELDDRRRHEPQEPEDVERHRQRVVEMANRGIASAELINERLARALIMQVEG
ncbi:hypothetical protein JX265_002115 [Neoarthrinium moseri]|uniref:Uncharacterized protein n=1 Tax=Neoarthrinium moseri TaxID=1658444 RepID=A0A9Q0AUG7_9PEZI|nr:hypothetical protein JX265_002115 [Neoarthrinium moseri]